MGRNSTFASPVTPDFCPTFREGLGASSHSASHRRKVRGGTPSARATARREAPDRSCSSAAFQTSAAGRGFGGRPRPRRGGFSDGRCCGSCAGWSVRSFDCGADASTPSSRFTARVNSANRLLRRSISERSSGSVRLSSSVPHVSQFELRRNRLDRGVVLTEGEPYLRLRRERGAGRLLTSR